jgi:hypothetical protein
MIERRALLLAAASATLLASCNRGGGAKGALRIGLVAKSLGNNFSTLSTRAVTRPRRRLARSK